MSKFAETLTRMRQLPEWVWGHAFSRIEDLSQDSEGSLIYANEQAEPTEANLVTSRALDQEAGGPGPTWGRQVHRPLLDIDFEAALIPSSTPGHYHLYLDKPMSRQEYVELLKTLQRVGILQRGFVDSAIGSELGTTLRVPWAEKAVQEIKQEARG